MSDKICQIENYFYNNDKNLIHKWDHYFEIYDRHFKKYKNKDIVLLEVGVSRGGSLQMWSDYFGKGSKFFGIDIDPRCKEFENENTKIFIGSQSDRKFLNYVKENIPHVDILIDDGGHHMKSSALIAETTPLNGKCYQTGRAPDLRNTNQLRLLRSSECQLANMSERHFLYRPTLAFHPDSALASQW